MKRQRLSDSVSGGRLIAVFVYSFTLARICDRRFCFLDLRCVLGLELGVEDLRISIGQACFYR